MRNIGYKSKRIPGKATIGRETEQDLSDSITNGRTNIRIRLLYQKKIPAKSNVNMHMHIVFRNQIDRPTSIAAKLTNISFGNHK